MLSGVDSESLAGPRIEAERTRALTVLATMGANLNGEPRQKDLWLR